MARERGRWWDSEHRQGISFFVGLGLAVYEVGFRDAQRPYVLAFIAALIGAPVVGLLDRLPRYFRGDGDHERLDRE